MSRVCSIEGCERAFYALTFCRSHYRASSKYGDPLHAPATPQERFWKWVDKSGPVPDYAPHLGACWMWTGQLNNNGYATFWFAGKKRLAYRVLWVWGNGPIAVGLELDHLCRVTACVNPSHLEPVTHRENLLRGPGSKPVCKNGHPFDEVNTRRHPVTGTRKCRACERERDRLRVPRTRRAA